jgi:hypothetical protein
MSEEKIPKFSEFARGKKHLYRNCFTRTWNNKSYPRGGNMKTESTIEPNEIYIDKIRGGRARLLCRWNVETITRIDEMTEEEQTIYRYEEAALWWTFPHSDNGNVLDNILAIDSYVQANKEEIMNFARGTQISIKEAA